MTLAVPADAESAPGIENVTGETAARRPPRATRSPDALRARYGGLDGIELLRPLIEREFAGRLAVVSSFGAESAVLLAMVAEIDRRTPVLFLDTGKSSRRRCGIATA
jgi:3'-phosphoadenosine 5'-phosphosulfate sulfotransferase (PAPS reductase)/FAD synthetase